MCTVEQILNDEPYFRTMPYADVRVRKADESAVVPELVGHSQSVVCIFTHGRFVRGRSDDFARTVFCWRDCDLLLPPARVYWNLRVMLGGEYNACLLRTIVRATKPRVLSVCCVGYATSLDIQAFVAGLADANAFASVTRVHFTRNVCAPNAAAFIDAVVHELANWDRLVYFDFFVGGRLSRSIACDDCAPIALKALNGCEQPIMQWCPPFHGGASAKMQMVISAFVMGMAVRVGFDRLDPVVLEDVLRHLSAVECIAV